MWGSILFYARKTDLVLIDTYSTLNFWYAYTCSLWCRLLLLKYIPILHGGNLPVRFQKNPKQTSALVHYAYRTVIPSAYLQEHLKKYDIPRSVVIPNTLELINYTFHQRPMHTPKLLWVRAIDSIYNPELALQTLVELRKTYPTAELTMVGPYKGISEHEWLQTLERYNIPVTMTGLLSKEALIALAKESTVFINTTTIDNMPVSVMEAMALGLPVVSTNVGGIPYLLTHEKSSLLVPSNEPQAMANAIKRLISEPVLSEQIALAARKVVEEMDWEVVKVQWREVLG
jgi:glycosyltransferase involved in cell wall biosynthesis